MHSLHIVVFHNSYRRPASEKYLFSLRGVQQLYCISVGLTKGYACAAKTNQQQQQQEEQRQRHQQQRLRSSSGRSSSNHNKEGSQVYPPCTHAACSVPDVVIPQNASFLELPVQRFILID